MSTSLQDIDGTQITLGNKIMMVEDDGTHFVGNVYVVEERNDFLDEPGTSLVAVGNGHTMLMYPERAKYYKVVNE